MAHHRQASRKTGCRDTHRRSARRHRLVVSLLPLLFLATTLVWLAPSIVAHTGLKHKIVAAILADFEGHVQIGAASLGWFSPVRAWEITAVDPDGAPLAEIAAFQSERTLLRLLTDGLQWGDFLLENPHFRLAVRPGGSNWEDALVAYRDSASDSSESPAFRLILTGGVIEVHDASHPEPWQLDEVDGRMQLSPAGGEQLEADFVGRLHAGADPPGRVDARLVYHLGGPPGQYGSGRLDWELEAASLRPGTTLFEWFDRVAQLDGTVSSRGHLKWQADLAEPELQIDRLAGQRVAIRYPPWLGQETLASTSVNARGLWTYGGSRWHLEDVFIEADFGHLEAEGSLPPLALASGAAWADLIRELQQRSVQMAGRLDLPPIAQTLPETLRIRSGIDIESGSVRFALASEAAAEPRFHASLIVDDLAASDGSRTFAWSQPLAATADFRYTAEGPVVDRLVAQAEFLELTAEGSLTEGSARVHGKLDRLKDELRHFVELGELELAGQLDGDLDWQQAEDGQVTATGRLQMNRFRFAQNAGAPPWNEERLVVDIAAAADIAGGQILRIPAVSLNLQSEQDMLNVRLSRPVEAPWTEAVWPLHLEAGGHLQTWLPRLQPLGGLGDWDLTARVDLDALLHVGAEQVVAERMRVNLNQLRAAGGNGRPVIEEPTVQFETGATWQPAANRIVATDTTFTSSTLAFRGSQVVLQLPDPQAGDGLPLRANGQFSYRTDLQRLQSWFQPASEARHRVSGAATGRVQASYQGGSTYFDGSIDIQDLLVAVAADPPPAAAVPTGYAPSWEEVWREPAVQASVRGMHDAGQDTVQLVRLAAHVGSLELAAEGEISRVSAEWWADVQGTLDYDLAELGRRARNVLGPSVALEGRQQGRFSLHGPLMHRDKTSPETGATVRLASQASTAASPVPPELTGSFDFGWQAVQAYGMNLGPGELHGKLRERVVRVEPLNVPLAEGHLRVAPRLELGEPPLRMVLDEGPLIERVRISPEICAGWLKYVAPLLADATRAEGQFSVSLDGASIPLGDVEQGSAAGAMTIHSAQVGPGPLAQEFLAIAQQIRSLVIGRPPGSSQAATWLLLPEQELKFHVRNGRIQHQGLTVTAGDVVMRTSGSVGLDQSLALVAEVPIQEAWVQDRRLLRTLEGTTLQIPIRGTLARPQIDDRALGDLNRQMMEEAAGRVLEEQIHRGLDRLFGPQP